MNKLSDNKLKDKKNKKIIVGITHGDINGIGYEIILKTLSNPQIIELFTPVVYGNSKVTSYYRKTLKINDFSFNIIKNASTINHRRSNLINCYFNKEIKIESGKSTSLAGKLSYLSLEAAVDDLKKNLIDVLVTAPINKKNIQAGDFNFPGHTEYLSQKFDADNTLMLMVNEGLRVGVVTGHLPIKDVSSHITQDLLLKKINVLNDSLIKDFDIIKPRIAVLGLNPHASDDGLIGNEENDVIIPAINKAFDNNIIVYGPYPADGFFGSGAYKKFDGVLAMYHDQGLIPFKTLSDKNGVNFTAGLPIVRTSPGHGTAYDIAGKNKAYPDSFRQAIYLACDIYRKRLAYEQMHENVLKEEIPEFNNNKNNLKNKELQELENDNS